MYKFDLGIDWSDQRLKKRFQHQPEPKDSEMSHPHSSSPDLSGGSPVADSRMLGSTEGQTGHNTSLIHPHSDGATESAQPDTRGGWNDHRSDTLT